MQEKSHQEKDVAVRNTAAHRLSESRPIFKPVLVKKLLEDESDDDSDEQAPNSDSSEEEIDDFDGVQPLPDDAESAVAKNESSEANVTESVEALKVETVSTYSSNSVKVNKYVTISNKTEEERTVLDKCMNAGKRKSTDSTTVPLYRQPKSVNSSDERKSISREQCESNKQTKSSPEVKRDSVSNLDVVKEKVQHFESFSDAKSKTESSKYPSKHSDPLDNNINIKAQRDDKIRHSSLYEKIPSKVQEDDISAPKVSTSHSLMNNTHGVIDTPLKHPPSATRPKPSNSHRNIFQTPQNKNEYIKNPEQTPATIFSHWSLQSHMAQTPMHNHVSSSREPLQTPATSGIMSRHQPPRYYSGENKNVRRPLAEAMHAGNIHTPQPPKPQGIPNEAISREQETLEKKPVYISHEIKENSNPNPADKKIEYIANQVKLSDAKQAVQIDRPNMEYRSMPRPIEKYENYLANQVVAQPVHAKQMSIPISQPNRDSGHSKIITVQNAQYKVLGIIGQGMSCKVVRAQDLSSSEMRAIKCVDLSKMDKDSAQGCLQEICMLDRLRAPCIVTMYHFEIKQTMLYVVMEMGDTDFSSLLKSMMAEKKRIPLSMIYHCWTEMLTAVKHIHDNGVIHSDLKPANFLMVRGRLKLIDFGIASNINADMTSVVKNCPIGTLNYISPEALMDINAGNTDSPNHSVKYKISYKSDVWSLGCILYALIYGVTPFHNYRQQWAKISAITDPKHKISFPSKTGSESVPAILFDVMRRCLQRDPKARPTVAELLEVRYFESMVTTSAPKPDIPLTILMKIKNALSKEEWDEFIAILDQR